MRWRWLRGGGGVGGELCLAGGPAVGGAAGAGGGVSPGQPRCWWLR